MHHGRLQDAPFHPVLGRTGGIQKTAMGSQGSQVKFGRSQSRKVISESHESPNVQHWRNLENVSRRNSTYITYKKRQKFIKKTFKKMAQKVLDGVGLELATHRATPPGDPGLQSLRNIFSMPKCRHRNSEFRKSTKSSNLQVQPQSGLSFRFFSLNLKKNKSKPHGILPLHSPRYPIQQLHESPGSEPTADEHHPKRREKTGQNSSWRPGHEFAFKDDFGSENWLSGVGFST